MQVEEMRDFFSQEITYEKISAILQAMYSCIFCQISQTILPKNGICPRIFQHHMGTIISEAVAEVQKDFYKIYFFE